jgi:CheY-like chemotaxis protein
MVKLKRILLVDDDEISNFINERKLKGSAIADRIDVCISGMRAMQLLQEIVSANDTAPEVILLDINMPIMDGFGFLDEFVKLPDSFISDIKVAMLTSSLEKEEIRRSYEYKNVVDFINKPLSTEKIVALIEKMK